jgi:hypothetical protein
MPQGRGRDAAEIFIRLAFTAEDNLTSVPCEASLGSTLPLKLATLARNAAPDVKEAEARGVSSLRLTKLGRFHLPHGRRAH